MMLCDFHIHSHFSDGRLSIPELVDLYGKRGFGAIAITDHLCEESSFLGQTAHFFERTLTRETFPHYLEILREEAERAWRMYRMLVIPGYELTKNSFLNRRSAHVVVLGAEEYLSADQEIPDLLRQVRGLGGLSIAAHPVSTGHLEPQTYYLWSRRQELANKFDAWEVASGRHIFDEVLHSGLPMIANSDLHHPRQMSSWKTKLHCERHRDAIFRAIRKQEVEFTYFQDPGLAQSFPLLGFSCDPLKNAPA
ncbi:MAG: PHP domain-containing protein [Bdellovibrionales bacterium]